MRRATVHYLGLNQCGVDGTKEIGIPVQELGFEPPLAKGQRASNTFATDEGTLATLVAGGRDGDPRCQLPRHVLEYRALVNARGKFLESSWVEAAMQRAAAGEAQHGVVRVHCQWNQTGTATGEQL